jgi:drug/metabolite transporter (DMT)-like permease
MSERTTTNQLRGLIALVLLALIYGITGIFARYFTMHLGVFEQWYLRFFVALIVTIIVFRRKIDYHKFMHISRTEWTVMSIRGIVGFVGALWLYAESTHYTTIGSVAAMQIVPTTALLGVIIFHEKVSKAMLGLIVLSFAGAAIVALHDVAHLTFGVGEIMSLVSGALFSLSLVLRKKQTGELNNYELVFGVTAIALVGNYLLNVITGGDWTPASQAITPTLGLLLVIAGALSALMSLLANYGFEHVKATTATVILNLELVFGALFGYMLYREVLTPRQTFGALVILLASSTVAYLEAKKPTLVTEVPAENEYNERHASEIV